MTVNLNGEYDIANGEDRTLQVLDTESFTLQQTTQVAQPMRAAWPVAFHSRASRKISLQYPVMFPPCACLEDAVMQARTIAITCPKGGPLVEYHTGVRHTYEDSWVESIEVRRMGLTNHVQYSLTAINPTSVSLLVDENGDILLDENGAEIDN